MTTMRRSNEIFERLYTILLKIKVFNSKNLKNYSLFAISNSGNNLIKLNLKGLLAKDFKNFLI